MAGRDVVKNDRWGIAPTLAFGLGTTTRFTLGYYKLKQDNISDYGIPWIPATNNALAEYRDQPAPVPRNTFYGFRDRDREVLNQDTGTVKFERDFSRVNAVTHATALRTGRTQLNGNTAALCGQRYHCDQPRAAFLGCKGPHLGQPDRPAHAIPDVRASAILWSPAAAFTNEQNTRINRTGPNSPTTLLNPNPDDIYTGVIVTSPFVGDLTGNTQAVWAFDTAKLGNHWEATGGLRWERFTVDGVSTVPLR